MGDWDPVKIAGAKRVPSGTWVLFYHRWRGLHFVASYSRYTREVMIWPAVVQKILGKVIDFAPDVTAGELWQSEPGDSPGKIFSDIASGKLSLADMVSEV